MRRTPLAPLVTLALHMVVGEVWAQAAPAEVAPCRIDASAVAWTQEALRDWEMATTAVLRTPPRPLPTIVLFDAACAWQLTQDSGTVSGAMPVATSLRYAGRDVTTWARRHRGMIVLPSGDSLPARPVASAIGSSAGRAPFFVLALPSVFRQDSAMAARPRLDLFLRSVVSHEMLHTTQLPSLVQAIQALGQRYRLPDGLDDDIVQRRFESDSAFRADVARERELLFAAAFDVDEAHARSLAREALARLRERRARYYVDSLAAFSRLEDLFFTMEGSAEWVRFRLHRHHGDFPTDAETLAFLRGARPYWSQDQGLALFLVVDRFVPNWTAALLAPSMPSPTAALETAVRARPVAPGRERR